MSKLDDLRINTPVPRPRHRRHVPWLPVVVVLFVVAVALWLGRDRLAALTAEPASTAVSSTADQAADLPPVETGPAGSISAAGYLEVIPPGPTVVSSMVSGRVAEVAVTAGQAVSKGEVLARLDTGLLSQQAAVLAPRVELASRQLELKQAGFRTEEVAQAQADLASATAGLELAAADLQRSQQLYDQGVVSRQELDAHQAAYLQAQALVDTYQSRLSLQEAGSRPEDIRIAEAQLAAARAEVNRVHWEIAQCTIQAPADGVVYELFVQPGSWITPGADSPLSGALLSTFDPAQVQAWVDVNQRDSAALFIGQQVELRTDAEPQRVVTGYVTRIMPQANLQKNTVQAKITIPAPPADFRPQLSVKVVFLPAEHTPTPEQAGEIPPTTEVQ